MLNEKIRDVQNIFSQDALITFCITTNYPKTSGHRGGAEPSTGDFSKSMTAMRITEQRNSMGCGYLRMEVNEDLHPL